MNIAIVDDEKIELETAEVFLRVYIKKFYSKYESAINIETFYRTEDFLMFFSPNIYQIVVIGYNMREIINFIGDCDVKIIFIKPQEEFL